MKYLLFAAICFVALSASAQTKQTAVGCWKMASKTGESLRLDAEGTFSFNDFSKMTGETEYLYGNWRMEGKTIFLMYDDRPQQRFFMFKDKAGKWRLRKAGGFQFVKASPSECGSAKK